MVVRRKAPRGPSKDRNHRALARQFSPRLIAWAQKRLGWHFPPRFNKALESEYPATFNRMACLTRSFRDVAALEAIRTLRSPLYREPWIQKSKLGEGEPTTKAARDERHRRAVERRLYEQFSRYYPRGRLKWERMKLLLLGERCSI